MRQFMKLLACFVLVTVIFINSEQKVGAETYVDNYTYTSEGQSCVYIDEEIKQTSKFFDFGRFILIAISAGAGSVAVTLLILHVLNDDRKDQGK